MKVGWAHVAMAVVLAIVAGCIGAVATENWRSQAPSAGLHDFVHNELDLSSEQHASLEQIEGQFVAERSGLELTLRAANAQLANAMEDEHSYGPKVNEAIDEVHDRMGALQKATVRHVFAMRGLLDQDQQVRFDRQVAKALTAAPDE